MAWVLLLAGGWLLLRALRTSPAADAPAAAPPEDAGSPPDRPAARLRRVARTPRRAVAAPRRAGGAGAGVRPAVVASVAALMLIAGVAAALGVRAEDAGDTGPGPLWSRALGAPADAASEAQWAPVMHAAAAFGRPGDATTRVGVVAARTPEGARNLVVLADGGPGRAGRRWVRVRLGGDAGAGWVRRAALGRITTVRTHLYVDLTARRLTLVRRGRVVLQAPAGVGTAGAPTPAGEFHVRSRLVRYAGAFYGPVAFGLDAAAPGLSDWPVAGSIGIHGTNRPQLVPGSVSRGSVRLRNPDLRRLAHLMPLGTPVTIR